MALVSFGLYTCRPHAAALRPCYQPVTSPKPSYSWSRSSRWMKFSRCSLTSAACGDSVFPYSAACVPPVVAQLCSFPCCHGTALVPCSWNLLEVPTFFSAGASSACASVLGAELFTSCWTLQVFCWARPQFSPPPSHLKLHPLISVSVWIPDKMSWFAIHWIFVACESRTVTTSCFCSGQKVTEVVFQVTIQMTFFHSLNSI